VNMLAELPARRISQSLFGLVIWLHLCRNWLSECVIG
jgi:hypothetical protein